MFRHVVNAHTHIRQTTAAIMVLPQSVSHDRACLATGKDASSHSYKVYDITHGSHQMSTTVRRQTGCQEKQHGQKKLLRLSGYDNRLSMNYKLDLC